MNCFCNVERERHGSEMREDEEQRDREKEKESYTP